MISTPHFQSHEQQQAMLGCAAKLDPAKHPRRYAQQQARQRLNKEVRWLEHATTPQGIAQNQQHLEQVRQALAEKRERQLREMAATGASIIRMASALKLSRRKVMLMLAELKIPRGPKMQLEA